MAKENYTHLAILILSICLLSICPFILLSTTQFKNITVFVHCSAKHLCLNLRRQGKGEIGFPRWIREFNSPWPLWFVCERVSEMRTFELFDQRHWKWTQPQWGKPIRKLACYFCLGYLSMLREGTDTVPLPDGEKNSQSLILYFASIWYDSACCQDTDFMNQCLLSQLSIQKAFA